MWTAGQYAEHLEQVNRNLSKYLTREGKQNLRDVISRLRTDKTATTWKLEFTPEKGLIFLASSADKRLAPEIIARIVVSEGKIDRMNVEVWVWSREAKLSFRKDYDAPAVHDLLRKKGLFHRVVMKIHFDKALPGSREPLFHVQAGGIERTKEREIMWMPSPVIVPRIPVFPVDLIVASELVLASYFPREYDSTRRDNVWNRFLSRTHYALAKETIDELTAWCGREERLRGSLHVDVWGRE